MSKNLLKKGISALLSFLLFTNSADVANCAIVPFHPHNFVDQPARIQLPAGAGQPSLVPEFSMKDIDSKFFELFGKSFGKNKKNSFRSRHRRHRHRSCYRLEKQKAGRSFGSRDGLAKENDMQMQRRVDERNSKVEVGQGIQIISNTFVHPPLEAGELKERQQGTATEIYFKEKAKDPLEDIQQGNIGDCYLIASLIAIFLRMGNPLENCMSRIPGNEKTTFTFNKVKLQSNSENEVEVKTQAGDPLKVTVTNKIMTVTNKFGKKVALGCPKKNWVNLLEKAFILYKFGTENVIPSSEEKGLLKQMIEDWRKWKSWDEITGTGGNVSPSALTLGCGAIPMVAITGRQARVKKIESDPSKTYKEDLLRDLKENENKPVVVMTKRSKKFEEGKMRALDDGNIWTWHVYALHSVDKNIIRLINPHRALSSLYVDIKDIGLSSPIKVVLPSKSFYEPEVVCDWIYDNLGELRGKLTSLQSDFLIKSIIENKGKIAQRYYEAVAEKEKSAAMADYEKNKNDLKNLILNRREEQISIKVLRSVRDAILRRFSEKSGEGDSFCGLLEINIDDFCKYFDTYEILELEKTKQ